MHWPPDIVGWLLLLLVTTSSALIPARPSCRHHYLAGIRETTVLPLKGEGSTQRLVCHMPQSYDGPETLVTTEIASGLENPTTVTERGSVNFQAEDLIWLRELVRSSSCRQEVTIDWNTVDGERGEDITLVSLLNDTVRVPYIEGRHSYQFELVATLAGVRHLLPEPSNEVRKFHPIVKAGSLFCEQQIAPKRECLTSGQIEVQVPMTGDWSYEFAFRTDQSDQPILALVTAGSKTVVHVIDELILQVGDEKPVAVGHISDSEWHSIVVEFIDESTRILVDDVVVKTSLRDRLTRLDVVLEGQLLLIDENDVIQNCGRALEAETQTKLEEPAFCEGCDCSYLKRHFKQLTPPSCQPDDDQGFHFLRDPEKLSLFRIPDAFTVTAHGDVDIRTALTFRSDSDAGLLLFGYWVDAVNKGRWQVHYSGFTVSAILCSTFDNEQCNACEIRYEDEIGSGDWRKVIFYGSDGEFRLVVNEKVCLLREIGPKNNVSLAEMYVIPPSSGDAELFVGGTYFEKKQAGLYKKEFTQKYFENTREKMTSLRGCIKEVFVKGAAVDLSQIYQRQMSETLVKSGDLQAYAIQIGCAECEPTCEIDVRCRSPASSLASVAVCDCADAFEVNSAGGKCQKQRGPPAPLSSHFLAENPVVVTLENTKAVLSKLWLKLRFPTAIPNEVHIAEFNSHREPMFRISLRPDGLLKVEAHPHDGNNFQTTVSKQYDLSDDRVHLISISRRTPVGTRYNSRKYDLLIDGSRFELPDSGKSVLNNISFPLQANVEETGAVIIHDVGVGYDYDEHMFISHPSNTIHQVDIHSKLVSHLYRTPDLEKCGVLDPYLWDEPLDAAGSYSAVNHRHEMDVAGGASPHGKVVAYTPDAYQPQLLLSSRWVLYSLIIFGLLLLLGLVFLCCYLCVCRRVPRSNASDREQMMRDSPDYPNDVNVKLRRESGSYDGEGSIGTDDTDLNAYRDINSHRVKIYRESMVSILVPSMDVPAEAAIVHRHSLPTLPSSTEVNAPPTPTPGSPAPLVTTEDDH